jgi:dihydroorotase
MMNYTAKGNLIKWNPAKRLMTEKCFRKPYWMTIDVVCNAMHIRRKKQSYLNAPSGGPLVQHAVVAMFDASSRKH